LKNFHERTLFYTDNDKKGNDNEKGGGMVSRGGIN